MKRLSAYAITAAAVAVLVFPAVFAQNPANQRGQDDQTKIETLIVRLPITVKDKKEFVTGLRQTNFEVYEDDKLQKIDKFDAPSQLPLRIGLLMDTSNSVKLKLPIEKAAAEDFVATVTTFRKKDKVLFATFDSDVELHVDFTDDLAVLVAAIRSRKAGGYTKMYDAVYRVIEEKMTDTAIRTEARRIIVVLSDGEDTASERTLKEAIQMAQRYDVTIFGISTKNFSGAGVGAGTVETEDDKELRLLCEMTGGQVFLPSEKAELFRAFTQVEKDLRQEYIAFYTPRNQNKTGKPRKIEVKLVNAKGRLHYKQGYVY